MKQILYETKPFKKKQNFHILREQVAKLSRKCSFCFLEEGKCVFHLLEHVTNLVGGVLERLATA